MTEPVLVDTNFFIEIFRRRNDELQEVVDAIAQACINTIVYFELVRGEPSKHRYQAMEAYLQKYNLIQIDPTTCEVAIDLMRKFKLTKGLDFPDALLAATCVQHDLWLFTRNKRHFDFIPDLILL